MMWGTVFPHILYYLPDNTKRICMIRPQLVYDLWRPAVKPVNFLLALDNSSDNKPSATKKAEFVLLEWINDDSLIISLLISELLGRSATLSVLSKDQSLLRPNLICHGLLQYKSIGKNLQFFRSQVITYSIYVVIK